MTTLAWSQLIIQYSECLHNAIISNQTILAVDDKVDGLKGVLLQLCEENFKQKHNEATIVAQISSNDSAIKEQMRAIQGNLQKANQEFFKINEIVKACSQNNEGLTKKATSIEE